jgi:voltage-gated potassium channel
MEKNSMVRQGKGAVTRWNAVLLFSVIFAAFILPVLPVQWHRGTFRFVYTVIYVAAIYSLERKSRAMIALMFTTFLIEWLSMFFHMTLLLNLAKGFNVLFFLIIVAMLIRQIAMAKEVNTEIILGSIIGYLLLGVVYSIFVSFILQHDPAAFNCQITVMDDSYAMTDTSVPLYFSFVTMGTLGYGDILPLKPYTRAFATWITVSGQLYIAVIISLLVGKFSARKRYDEP